MPNTTNKPIRPKGFYLLLRDIKCDCGNPATRQVQVQLYNANSRAIKQVMPLCDECYQLMCAEDSGILQAA